jgi:hypothetical protein
VRRVGKSGQEFLESLSNRLFRLFHHEHFDGRVGGHQFKAKLIASSG